MLSSETEILQLSLSEAILCSKVQNTIDPAMKIKTKHLDERESKLVINQRKACEERMKLKLQKAVNLNVMVMRLLSDCKSWGGPGTSAACLFDSHKQD